MLECLKGLLSSQLLNCNDPHVLSPGLIIYFGYGMHFSVQRKRLMTGQTRIETVSGKTDTIINEVKL